MARLNIPWNLKSMWFWKKNCISFTIKTSWWNKNRMKEFNFLVCYQNCKTFVQICDTKSNFNSSPEFLGIICNILYAYNHPLFTGLSFYYTDYTRGSQSVGHAPLVGGFCWPLREAWVVCMREIIILNETWAQVIHFGRHLFRLNILLITYLVPVLTQNYKPHIFLPAKASFLSVSQNADY
jgi:hypothetical protein